VKRIFRFGTPRSLVVPGLAACLAIGFVAGWVVRGHAPVPSFTERSDLVLPRVTDDPMPAEPRPVGTGDEFTSTSPEIGAAVEELREHDLRVPIDGADVERFKGQFDDPRDAGGHEHEAVDILAPRHTPVHAVEDGTIAKLFFSKGGGGNTVYQFDPSSRFCYYYAHLERYADGLHNAQHVSRGDVIGYVGTSGNAPPDTPHLHFAIFVLTPARQWWKGRPIDPYLAYER
jgi:murein DD-endopeptidase MepM/ murein hydrolase activator NlpD